jgi:hypothetical protein
MRSILWSNLLGGLWSMRSILCCSLKAPIPAPPALHARRKPYTAALGPRPSGPGCWLLVGLALRTSYLLALPAAGGRGRGRGEWGVVAACGVWSSWWSAVRFSEVQRTYIQNTQGHPEPEQQLAWGQMRWALGSFCYY